MFLDSVVQDSFCYGLSVCLPVFLLWVNHVSTWYQSISLLHIYIAIFNNQTSNILQNVDLSSHFLFSPVLSLSFLMFQVFIPRTSLCGLFIDLHTVFELLPPPINFWSKNIISIVWNMLVQVSHNMCFLPTFCLLGSEVCTKCHSKNFHTGDRQIAGIVMDGVVRLRRWCKDNQPINVLQFTHICVKMCMDGHWGNMLVTQE